MKTDSTVNLFAKDELSSSPVAPRPLVIKSPLKRLGSRIKQEIDDLRAFNAMSLEEIRILNHQKMAEHIKRQDEKEQKMTEKYGVVGKVVAKTTRTTLRNRPCCALGVVSTDGI